MDSDEEIIVVLAGTLEITVRNETHTLRTGDSITFDPRTPHIYRNPSAREAARTLCIMAPPPK
jgi:quercetin dioxygenase-like cupin family protein